MISANDAASSAVSGGVAGAVAAAPSNPGAITTLALIKMLSYIRYLKIDYPDKVKFMLKNQNSSPIGLTFGPAIPSEIKESLRNGTIPENFSKYGLHSSILVNFWK